ncbi:MAG: PilZ domain-containing protein [Candidatus Acidiferrales bacterium]
MGPDQPSFSEPLKRQANSSPERRRAPRAKPTGLTYVKFEPDNGGTLVDVCESGIRFQVIAPVEERGRIQLWFVLDTSSHIEVSGELAWIDDSKRCGGLKFTQPSKQARQQLRTWLSRQRLASAPMDAPADAMNEPRSAPPAELEARSSDSSPDSDLEGQLQNLPHTDPAPLESLLDNILTSLQRPHPEELFARPPATLDNLQPVPPAPEFRSSAPANLSRDTSPKKPSIGAAVPPIHRRAPRSSAPTAKTPPLPAREARADSPPVPRSEQASESKFAQFGLTVNRVSGMLSVLRHAIASEDSEWPLTIPPEIPPAAAAPSSSTVALEAAPQTAAQVPEHVAEEVAEPVPQIEIDVRPWSAGAPWRAAESPVVRESWRTRLGSRMSEYILAIRESFAAALSEIAGTANTAVTSTAQFSREAVAALAATVAPATRATKAAASTTVQRTWRAVRQFRQLELLQTFRGKLARKANVAKRLSPQVPSNFVRVEPAAKRASRPARNWRQLELLQSFRSKITDAASATKRASSTAISTVVPVEPTSSEIRILLGITAALLIGLLMFSYRDKFNSPTNYFTANATPEFTQRETPAEPSPAPKKTPARIVKARVASPAPARTEPVRSETPVFTRPSTPEFARALAYLRDDGNGRSASTAAQWLWAATRKGDTAASIVLADLYIRGDGVPQNCAQGRVLLLAASRKGNEQATRKLQEFDAAGCVSTAQ